MALFKSEITHKIWSIKNFPTDLRVKLKARCKKDKKEMVEVARLLVREYVDETSQMYKNKEYRETPEYALGESREWRMSSFPVKLHADFKGCCISRGDTIEKALTHKVKEYVDGV